MECSLSVLNLVLTYHWFDEIESGRKTHEYRRCSPYWNNVMEKRRENIDSVVFHRGYTAYIIKKEVKSITIVDGKNTDLHINEKVYDIELGEKL